MRSSLHRYIVGPLNVRVDGKSASRNFGTGGCCLLREETRPALESSDSWHIALANSKQRTRYTSGVAVDSYPRVALVTMPFGAVANPPIQVALLQSIAREAGFACEAHYFNLDFAVRIGRDLYDRLATSFLPLTGEWLFSLAAFGQEAPDAAAEYLQVFADAATALGCNDAVLRKVRDEIVPVFLDYLCEDVQWQDYDLVGFSSTFQQTVPSLALARRLKARWPGLKVVFGGANCEGEMGEELLRKCHQLDYVVSGEGDQTFPEMLKALRTGAPIAAIPNVASRAEQEVVRGRRAPVFMKLDTLPTPDFHDFFDRAARLEVLPPEERVNVELPFEAARGCWWGQKHHCTFCGLNGGTMTFRSKSPERVIDELIGLSQTYGTVKFAAVDNIVDMSYFKTLFLELAHRGINYELFYEVKSNLTMEQVKSLRDAGVTRIQPGIESLSTHVLSLMEKGVTAIQNVNLLRWARHFNLGVLWNILTGFPGETANDYRLQADLMRNLHHLQPPWCVGELQVERFSPIFKDRQRFPARELSPHRCYSFIFPPSFALERVAFFFQADLANCLQSSCYDDVHKEAAAWSQRWRLSPLPQLTCRIGPGIAVIYDERPVGEKATATLRGPVADFYAKCMIRPRSIKSVAEEAGFTALQEREIESMVPRLAAEGLLMTEGAVHLALALPATPSQPGIQGRGDNEE